MTRSRSALILLRSGAPEVGAVDPPASLDEAFAPHRLDVGDDTDLALLARLRGGDPAALDALLERYWRPLAAYAARLLDSDDAGQDVAQETFLRLWARREELAPASVLRALLYRIARNIALNERRAGAVRARWAEREPDTLMPSDPGTPMHALIEHELEAAVTRAVDGLPPRRREAFVLMRFHGLSHRQIAEVMGLAPQTVANQIGAAVADLRRALGPFVADIHPEPATARAGARDAAAT